MNDNVKPLQTSARHADDRETRHDAVLFTFTMIR